MDQDQILNQKKTNYQNSLKFYVNTSKIELGTLYFKQKRLLNGTGFYEFKNFN